jgi:hypothetical protein
MRLMAIADPRSPQRRIEYRPQNRRRSHHHEKIKSCALYLDEMTLQPDYATWLLALHICGYSNTVGLFREVFGLKEICHVLGLGV